MKLKTLIVCVLLTALLPQRGLSQPADASAPADDPLAPFQKLIGGEWHLGESYQVFEWGVGRRSVRASSYFVMDGEARRVSEGSWYWHPREKTIRGVFTAVAMPVELFEYRTRFEGSTMHNELRAYDADGAETRYLETWDFVDADRFNWSLLRETPEGPREEMNGVYTRVRAGSPGGEASTSDPTADGSDVQ